MAPEEVRTCFSQFFNCMHNFDIAWKELKAVGKGMVKNYEDITDEGNYNDISSK